MTVYIGGEYIERDLRAHTAEGKGDMDLFFPFRLKGAPRYFFESASNGMAAILNLHAANGRVKVFFPDNFCRATIQVICQKTTIETVEVGFYETAGDLTSTGSFDVLVIVHYNGHLNPLLQDNPELGSRFIVIEDFVHRPFHIQMYTGQYAVNSLRKVLPVEVSIVYGIPDEHAYDPGTSAYYRIKKEAVKVKEAFLQGRGDENEYLDLFKEAEAHLTEPRVYGAQEREIGVLNHLCLDRVLEKRRDNYRCLELSLADCPDGDIEVVPGDYMFMMIKSSRQVQLREYLRGLGIFCAVHWADSDSELSKKVLSIPIDQRYGRTDMQRVGASVKGFFDNRI